MCPSPAGDILCPSLAGDLSATRLDGITQDAQFEHSQSKNMILDDGDTVDNRIYDSEFYAKYEPAEVLGRYAPLFQDNSPID